MTDTVHHDETLNGATDEVADGPVNAAASARSRLRSFTFHMSAFLIVMNVLIILNFIYTPHNWWFVLPLGLWGSPLALHAAYAMGLFKVFCKDVPR